jgi:hypothetical protein
MDGNDDPDPVPFSPLDPGFGMGKKSGSGSGMNNSDHIFKSLDKIFWVKILKFFDANPGSENEKNRVQDPRMKKILVRDPV